MHGLLDTYSGTVAAGGGGSVTSARHFLFLQGLPGPFFRRLGTELRARGQRVSRINFNGGDLLDWRGEDTQSYRGRIEDWPEWLARHVAAQGVTDIVVFGDCRAPHIGARALADRRGMRFHAFEEGYLRPNHVTLERGGVNGHSSFPRSMAALRHLTARLPDPGPEISFPNLFSHRARQAIAYHLAALLARPRYRHHDNHRTVPAWREAGGWMRRKLRRGAELRASRRAGAAIAGRSFFLFPLQIEGDAQLRHHCPFQSMQDAMEHIVAAFAAAPEGTMLLVKQHPLDPGVLPWRKLVDAAAARAGIPDRIAFVERYDLTDLLRAARGVVTVNSTVGPLALAEGTPVIALGDAVYRVPGVTATGGLDAFWHDPGTVDAANVDVFRHALKAKCLVNGGFHSEEGLARLIETSSERLLRG